MKFSAEHRFTQPPEAVAAVLVDPDFYRELVLPDLGQPEILSERPGEGRLTLRYEYVGRVDPMVTRLLGQRPLSWVQTVQIDRSTGRGSLEFGAEAQPNLVHAGANFSLTPDEAGTLRQLEGELVVAIPGLGRMAERRIVPGVLRRLDVEAEAVEERLGV